MASSYMNTQRGGSMSGGPTAELYGRQPPSATTYGGRTQAPSMRRFAQLPHLQWLWEGITAFWSWAWWLTTLPWQVRRRPGVGGEGGCARLMLLLQRRREAPSNSRRLLSSAAA